MNINREYITKINFTDKNNTGKNKYIVIHYFGGLSTAKNLAKYWATKYAGASAHYAVGHEGDIFQIVEDDDIAWHCGASSYKHAECRNSNSIGIEMAVRKKNTATLSASDKDWYFEEATIDAAVELTRLLMQKYRITTDHVIRHYDVTGKICPNPYVYECTEDTWEDFKRRIAAREVTPAADANTKPTEAGVKQLAGRIKIVYAGVDGVNYRTAPDYNAAAAGVVHYGEVFTIVGEEGDFWKLKSGAYLTKREDLVEVIEAI